MLILLSPAKTQAFETPAPAAAHSTPAFIDDTAILMAELAKLTKPNISTLMAVSEKIAALNHARFKHFKLPFTLDNAKQAGYAFRGDVYDGLQIDTMDEKAIDFAQGHLRILSGLYGVLKPLDLIQPYRLEMKIKLKNPRGKDLYQFWGDSLTDKLNEELDQMTSRVVINLASEEYFKAINIKKLNAHIITPQFKEKKGKTFKMVALFAKKARGSMAHYIIQRQIENVEALQFFAEDGYRLNVALSKPQTPVYTRESKRS